jgi:RNA polymerase sigma-70 factor (ECF subfamily)
LFTCPTINKIVKAPRVDLSEANRVDAPPDSLSPTLLQRLQAADAGAWERVHYLFRPTVYAWCLAQGLAPPEAEDVVQEVFLAVAGAIADFRRQRPHDSFRGWLFRITQNKVRDQRRRSGKQPAAAGGTTAQHRLDQVAEPQPATEDLPPAAADSQALYRRALDLIQSHFEERTWKAFWGLAVEGRPGKDVAADLGLSVGAVYIAKTRVLKRLREEFADLLGPGGPTDEPPLSP